MSDRFEYDRFGGYGMRGERVRLRNSKYVFIRFLGKWEFYTIVQSGQSRGLEMFGGYVDEPDQIAGLERAVRNEEIRLAADEWTRNALKLGARHT